ncbi:sulfatase-like hydrolase/transferase [Chitinophaga sp. MM2321]|uniref:sulfatase-like hydrolase/transferase n=1 Tax=Chitinophaga sp. MM2321 TaxID=3137178 RepID=UPI0032D58BC0
MKLKSIFILLLMIVSGSSNALSRSEDPYSTGKAKKVNIILIMADDMGYECLSSYGSASYYTPNLDKLAGMGVRFENCFSQPLCTPSRVKLMTGKHNFRNYRVFGYLDPKEKTFGNLFKDAGYSTCIAGKWQLNGISGKKLPGWEDVSRPNQFGFDEYCLWQLQNEKSEGERYANPLIVQNGKTLSRNDDQYGPDIFSNYILDFMDRKKNEPFFIYYPMALVHDPFLPTPVSRKWVDPASRHKNDNDNFKDMVAYSDMIVGKIVDKLNKLGLAENTLIIFTGDNGTNVKITSKMKDGRIIKGGKGTLTDAGTRVPLIAYWKGKSLKGAVHVSLVDFSDVFPTLAQAAGIAIPANRVLDGQSFLPQILGKPGPVKEYVYVDYQRKAFVRDHSFKLYDDGRFYDMKNDVLEQNPMPPADIKGTALVAKNKLQEVMQQMPVLKK